MRLALFKTLLILLNIYCGSNLLGLNNSAQALVFNESVDSSTSSPINVGNLDIGTNTISGSLITFGGDNFDGYLFNLPINTQITSLLVEHFGPVNSNITINFRSSAVSSSTGNFIDALGINFTEGQEFFNAANFPIDSTNNSFFIGNTGAGSPGGEVNYTYTIEVSSATPVPFNVSPNLGLLILTGTYVSFKLNKSISQKKK